MFNLTVISNLSVKLSTSLELVPIFDMVIILVFVPITEMGVESFLRMCFNFLYFFTFHAELDTTKSE